MICTIHQPSSILVQQFGMILGPNPCGNTFYFGPVGENCADVIKYFGKRGAYSPPWKTIAKLVNGTAAMGTKSDESLINWNREWRTTTGAKRVFSEIDGPCDESREELLPEVEPNEFAVPMWLQITILTKRLFKP